MPKTEFDFMWPEEVEVYSCEGSYKSDWIPDSLKEAIIFLQEKLNSIPEEYRDRAKIEFDSYEEYDSSVNRVAITYKRPANQEEIQKRFNQHKVEVKQRLEWAQKQIKDLQE